MATLQKKPLVLIMAGGKGERFWPRSRSGHPKQLQRVYSDRTLLQETIARARLITDANRIFVGCNEELKRATLKTHRELKPAQFIVEPQGRNTAPIIALAALHFEKKFPGATHVVLSADHYIAPPEGFRRTMEQALQTAEAGWLVTLGVRPSRPETGYGYIHSGPSLEDLPAHRIESFVEKPDIDRARQYLNGGKHFWNSGIFIWKGSAILEQFAQYAPEILEPIQNSFQSATRLTAAFAHLPSQPVDIAILEKSKRIAMTPAEFIWDDVGAWTSLERIRDPDESGNVLVSSGRKPSAVVAHHSKRNILATDRPLVALLGVEDLVVVEEPDVLFIASRKELDRIKELLAKMREKAPLQKYLK
ncbi:MAG: mannose-1-phosphate guanylyltransferase [Leptospirales bacterium]|nr:mannose-1-phosphate guanylyltransferase [Leptospirales bacterium]